MEHFYRKYAAPHNLEVLVLLLLGLGTHQAAYADSLAQWSVSYSSPTTQYMILERIYSGRVGSLSAAVMDPKEGTYIVPLDNGWAQLAKDKVTDGLSLLVVTAMQRHAKDKEPYTAVSYYFRDSSVPPTAISDGYANRERVHKVILPKLGQDFLLVNSVSTSADGTVLREAAYVYQMTNSREGNPIRRVWASKPSMRDFRLGFAALREGQPEELVLKTARPPQFSAYRWAGDRFEEDNTLFESHLKALPDSVWQY